MYQFRMWLAKVAGLSFLWGQNVGIGTNNPLSRLHVAGTDATLTVGPYGIGTINGRIVATGNGAELSFADRNLAAWPANPSAGNRYAWYAQGGNAYLWTPVNGDLVWVTASGFVGIGATPSHPLTVRKDAPANLHTASFTNAAGYGIFLGNLNNNLYGSIQSFGGGSHQPLILQPVGGSVGLGTTNPQSKLHVVDVIEASEPNPNVRSAMLTGDGAVELLRTTSSTPCPGTWGYVDFKNSRTDDYDGRIEYGTSCQNNQDEGFRFLRGLNGTLSIGTYGPSGWGHSSDARRKTDIQPLTNALERVLRLRPVYFRWKADPTQRQLGFLAQEVESVFPEVVSREGGEYVLYHGSLTAPLTAALQELYEVVKAQAEEIQRLRQRIEALERASKP